MTFSVNVRPCIVFCLFLIFLLAAGTGATSKTDSKTTPDSSAVQDTLGSKETLDVKWPEKDTWQPEYAYQGKKSQTQLYFLEGQSSAEWKEMASIEIVYGKTNTNVPGMARLTYLGTKKGCPDATWEIIQKGMNDLGQPFIIYEIDCPKFLNNEPSQVQLWKLIIGKTALFNLQYSYRGEKMPPERRQEILQMLNTAYIKVEKK